MASLEKRARGGYRIVFRFAGQKFSRSLHTKNPRAANATLARLEDNLHRAELGTFPIPDGVDVATVLLSDGAKSEKTGTSRIKTLNELTTAYFDGLRDDAIEEGTRKMMDIHTRHFTRVLGSTLRIRELNLDSLQSYVDQRSKEPGSRGKNVSPVTIKKEMTTLATIWKWAQKANHLSRHLPKDGLRYPKQTEKPPFQTYDQITRKINRGGLKDWEIEELWDCLFLTLPEVEDVLAYVKERATQAFVYPMVIFAAHTGARRSEMLRSEIDDLDFESLTITIREKKRVKGTYSTRTVPMSPFLAKILTDWIACHPGGRYTFCSTSRPKNKDAFAPLTRDQAHDFFSRTMAQSKWNVMRGYHVFRHSFCSNCAAAGVDQRLINAWVGHQTEEMVRRYLHLIPNQQQEAIRRVFG